MYAFWPFVQRRRPVPTAPSAPSPDVSVSPLSTYAICSSHFHLLSTVHLLRGLFGLFRIALFFCACRARIKRAFCGVMLDMTTMRHDPKAWGGGRVPQGRDRNDAGE
eukprot:1423378-Pyramimonas_sp.AAC.1